MKSPFRVVILAAFAAVLAGGWARAQEVSFKDPTGDDNGPGKYTYPTDTVYKPGSFDLTELKVRQNGGKVDFEVSVNSALEDPWGMKGGFAVQMVFIFIDTDGKEGSGFTKGLPGLNVAFAPKDAWDQVVILSPQPPGRVKSEVEIKAAAMKAAIVVPGRTRGSGRTISASVDKKDLGDGDITSVGLPGRHAVERGLSRLDGSADPQGQRVRGAAPLRRRHRRRLRPARHGRPRGRRQG